MTFLEDRDLDNVPTIPEYYRGKVVFVTGGSGFMGKVLIEKLLYSCPDLEKIYLLLRPKKGVQPEERLSAIYSSHCFDRLRNERPGVFDSKVFFVAGDVSDIGLGLSEDDRAILLKQTQILFHVAASVRFDDPLKVAVRLNLFGTKQVVDLAKDMKNLESFVHVSTSYANTNREVIEEILYPALGDWRETLEICETADDHTLKVLTPKFIGELPNTYVFTKQLAEHVVYEQKGKMPIVIVRPSIVISSHLEPVPGWIDNFNGPAGLMAASGKGILRTILSSPEIVSDYIPVDVAIKACIVASWVRGTKKLEATDDIPIYNDCVGKLNHMTMQDMVSVGSEIAQILPLKNALWAYGVSITTSKFKYNLEVLLFHMLPALLVDMILWIIGKNPMLVRVQRRIYTANMALHYYLTKQWTFSNRNLIALRSKIKDDDMRDFYYEIENIDKYEFYKQCCFGGRKYLLKETDDSLEESQAQYKRMVVLDKLVKMTFYGCLIWWIMRREFIRDFIQIIH
ncbi:fatty-acyl CoA reductase 1 [Danaus plexippus plexippus]|uniref:Fatty acyl-CoA reductase n=1 Tax=Danaus plexippus plexippus TaxID=278856 RepID=A0A212F0B3_DANPL|nr:fatty-acyl CoA reductase 1 [Danaus plexippus plexippus]